MSDKQPTLGKLLDGPTERDAVHVAIAPVIASEVLSAGEHVGFVRAGDTVVVGRVAVLIGIIDPFLSESVQPGQRCWLFLYPQTVTGMRHQWEHPAFVESGAVAESRRWIAELAAQIDQTPNRLMEAAELWIECGDYTYDNSEKYKLVDIDWKEFWRHYEIVTGRKPEDVEQYGFFTCSC